MKKILFSTTSFDNIDNGPALFANILYKAVRNSENFDVRFLTEDIQSISDRPKLYDLDLHQNKWNRFFYQFLRIFKYHKIVNKISKEFNFEVLIYNNAFTGVLSVLFFKKPVVVMINDDNKIAYKNIDFQISKDFFKYKILRYLERIAVNKASLVIVNSKFMESLVKDIYEVDADKVQILIKGIDLKKYNYKIRKECVEEINILFVKADFLRGGLFDLIEAVSLLHNSNIKLTIIGPPLDQINFIKKEFKKKGLTNFEIKGPTAPTIVKEYFDRADIFCVPSHKEALGVANMEALACGIPVVSTNVGGIPEVLNNGKCGWLVEPGSPKKLSEAIYECISNNKERERRSNNGYQFVQQFDSKNLVDNFLKIVDTVE